nr:hypothetical protein [Bacillus infantis]
MTLGIFNIYGAIPSEKEKKAAYLINNPKIIEKVKQRMLMFKISCQNQAAFLIPQKGQVLGKRIRHFVVRSKLLQRNKQQAVPRSLSRKY